MISFESNLARSSFWVKPRIDRHFTRLADHILGDRAQIFAQMPAPLQNLSARSRRI
ncbi:hypothetical protein QUB47_05820 [Microcoleus sp. AT9_B5]